MYIHSQPLDTTVQEKGVSPMNELTIRFNSAHAEIVIQTKPLL